MKWLIDDCRHWWRFWSVRLQLLGALLSGLLAFDPGALLSAWNAMPPAVRDVLPGHVPTIVGGALFALNMLSIVARQVKQPRLASSSAAVGQKVAGKTDATV